MKNQVVVPVGMKLLIKEIKPETKTKSGLYLPEIALKQTFQGKFPLHTYTNKSVKFTSKNPPETKSKNRFR